MEHSIAQFVLTLFTVLGYGGIAVAMAIESCCIPLPSELIMPLAGFLAVQQRFNLWGVALAGAVGCVIGSLAAYGIGSVGGRPLLLRYGRYVLISPHDAGRADAFFARYGAPAIFLARRMRQDSERNHAVGRVSLPAADLILPYAACSTAHTSPHRS